MEEFKKGSSRSQAEETLEQQIQKRITLDLTYKKDGVILNVTKLEGVTVFKELEKGEFIAEEQRWNFHFAGNAQFTFDNKTYTMLFDGYAEVKDGKCENISKVISLNKR